MLLLHWGLAYKARQCLSLFLWYTCLRCVYSLQFRSISFIAAIKRRGRAQFQVGKRKLICKIAAKGNRQFNGHPLCGYGKSSKKMKRSYDNRFLLRQAKSSLFVFKSTWIFPLLSPFKTIFPAAKAIN